MTEEKKEEPKTIKDLLNILDKRAKSDDERFTKLEESMLKISTDVSSINEALNKGIPNIVAKLKEHDQIIGAVLGQPTQTQQSTQPTQTSPSPQAQANPMGWIQMLQLGRAILGGSSGTSLEDFAKMAKAFAETADALEHFRRPVLPYGRSDLLLMRLGASRAYEYTYKGKKELTDEEIDRLLGLKEKEEEHKE